MKLIIKRMSLSLLTVFCIISGSLVLQAADDPEGPPYGHGPYGQPYGRGKKPWSNIENKETNNIFINNKTNYGFTVSVSTREIMKDDEEAMPSQIRGKKVFRNLINSYRSGMMKDFKVTGPGAITDTLEGRVFGFAGTEYAITLDDSKFESSSLKQTDKFEWKGGNSIMKVLSFTKTEKTGDPSKDVIKVTLEINYNNGRIDFVLSSMGSS